MKIIVVETDARGGLIHFAYQLAEAFAELGVETTLVTGQDYELAHLPHRAAVAPILRLWSLVESLDSKLPTSLRRGYWKLRRAWRGLVLAREWWRLTRFIERQQCDLVIFSIIRFPWLALYLKHLESRGFQLAQICHEFANRETSGRFGGAIATRLPTPYSCFSAIFLLSDSARDDFRATFPAECHKTHVVPHGPELLFESEAKDAAVQSAYRIADDQQVVLMFGGLRPSKGVPDLVDAFALLRERPNIRLIVAGYPSRDFDAEAEVARVQSMGLSGTITFDLRYVPMDELGALIRRADAVVFPYRSATSSGALALAQSLGRPVVAGRDPRWRYRAARPAGGCASACSGNLETARRSRSGRSNGASGPDRGDGQPFLEINRRAHPREPAVATHRGNGTFQLGFPAQACRRQPTALGGVCIHLSQSMAQARWTKAMNEVSVFSQRRAIRRKRLRRLKKFSIRRRSA